MKTKNIQTSHLKELNRPKMKEKCNQTMGTPLAEVEPTKRKPKLKEKSNQAFIDEKQKITYREVITQTPITKELEFVST